MRLKPSSIRTKQKYISAAGSILEVVEIYRKANRIWLRESGFTPNFGMSLSPKNRTLCPFTLSTFGFGIERYRGK